MRRFRVVSCLASSTQQMNSLRAKGVMSFQAVIAVELAISAWRRSAGSLCTTPPGTRWLLTGASVTSSVPLSDPSSQAEDVVLVVGLPEHCSESLAVKWPEVDVVVVGEILNRLSHSTI